MTLSRAEVIANDGEWLAEEDGREHLCKGI